MGRAVPNHTSVQSDAAADRALDESIDRVLGATFLRSILAMFVVDFDLRIVRANPAAHELVGADALVGRSYLEFHTAESAAQAVGYVARLRSGDLTHVHREGSMRTANGERRVVEIRSEALPELGGELLYLVQVRDVTAIREHEAALTAGERMYREVVDNLPNSTVMSVDRDMRLLLIAGALLQRFGYDTSTMRGQRLSDAIPANVLVGIADPIRAALRGEATDMDYTSPATGSQYRLRARPILSDDDRIVGGLLLSEDVSAERARQAQLEQMQELSDIGSCRYDVSSGWLFDAKLLDLIGVDTVEEGLRANDELVLPEDRQKIRGAYRKVLSQGGRATLEYRLRHGRTGELRYVRGTCDAVVDSDGKLLRAVLTHADITESVYSRRTAEAALAAAAQARTVLLRGLSDVLATERTSLADKAQRIADVAAAGLGDGALVRIFGVDRTGIESHTVAHPDPSVREILSTLSQGFESPAGPDGASVLAGALVTGHDSIRWAAAHLLADPGELRDVVEHFIAAPIRHGGAVLGILGVFRSDVLKPFVDGDEDLVQVLADRLGVAIDESRVQDRYEQQRQERTAIAGRLVQLTAEQRELLDQLAEVEERERVLLAEAIHDDPMQLIIAVSMRLEMISFRPEAPSAELDELVELLESAVERLRTLITALTPPDLSDGLGPALRRLGEGIFIGTRTRVSYTGPSSVRLDNPRTDTAYRVFREALVNARKHANADNVDLTLTDDGNSVLIQLVDDGVGAENFESGHGHLGLTTMRARAATEGGELTIRSTVGHGTTVALRLPAATESATR